MPTDRPPTIEIARPSPLGSFLKEWRERAGLTQKDLEYVTGIQRAYISSAELGRMKVLYPDQFNALHRVLQFPAWEGLQLMGYVTDVTDSDVHGGLIHLIRNLSADKQRALFEIFKTVVTQAPTLASPDSDGNS